MHMRNVILAILALAIVAYCQSPATWDNNFKVKYAANLNIGESYIDIINTGYNGVGFLGPGFGAPAGTGNICVNVYALSTDEQLDACCSCLITPDEVVSLGVNSSLLVKTLTGATETSEVIKLIGSNVGATTCANTAASVTAANIATGFIAFGTTLHATPVTGVYATTETPFAPAQFILSGAAGANDELHSLTGRCAAILGNGSTFGICAGCKAGALGASKN